MDLQHVDAMEALRKANIEKKGGSDALETHEGVRPDWLNHTQVWQLKEMVFKKLVDMEEYVEDNPPGMKTGSEECPFISFTSGIQCALTRANGCSLHGQMTSSHQGPQTHGIAASLCSTSILKRLQGNQSLRHRGAN